MDKIRQKYISVAELAKMLGISRIAVFKRIKKGQIPAEKIGRAYAISGEIANEFVFGNTNEVVSDEKKKIIEEAVAKVVKDYGETLKLLGKE